MFSSDDKEVITAFNELGLTYRWEQLNINLLPELHKREFQLLTHFYYAPGQAEAIQEVIEYHVLRDFDVLVKLIQIKNLNVKYFYTKIFIENNPPLLLNFMRDLDKRLLLFELRRSIEFAQSDPSPFLLSSDTFRRDIIEIRFTFTLLEDFFAN